MIVTLEGSHGLRWLMMIALKMMPDKTLSVDWLRCIVSMGLFGINEVFQMKSSLLKH
ncbi:hypothetical protein ACI8B_350009 [Acinetobacter proteolyticus]|uniref:Uncharacterized protein n=1 Tax=Acinetobacter proteolyticus TaxID=1776741 RepID=A0A653K8M0_9GAMM|nr:hypothetical protein ACI8B_350009 [Acinetobacter proteolyticus]